MDQGTVGSRSWLERWMTVSTTLSSGFPVLLNERATELAVYKGVGDIRVVLGRVVAIDIPGDAFVHHNPSAEVVLEISSLDDRPLPPWIRFDPRTGRLVVQAPPDAAGDWTIRLVARDQFGNTAVTVFRVTVERQSDGGGGRASLSDKLAKARAHVPALLAPQGGHST